MCRSTGPLNCANHLQVFLQLADVVSVDGPDVIETQLLEQHAPQGPGLDGVFELREEPFERVADHGQATQDLLDLGLQAGVERTHAEPVEIICQAATRGQIDILLSLRIHQQLLLQPARVVHRLEHDARGKGPVADHRHRVAALAVAEPGRCRT